MEVIRKPDAWIIPGNLSHSWLFWNLIAAKSLQSCLTPWDPIDGRPPGSPIPGMLQARTLEWVAISFSNAWKGKVKVKLLSRVRPSGTPWTAVFQAPPFMGFSRQEYWSGVPLPSPWNLINSKVFFKLFFLGPYIHIQVKEKVYKTLFLIQRNILTLKG